MAHATFGVLVRKLPEEAKHVEAGVFCTHYKHPEQNYEAVELAIFEATEEVAVVYRALYSGRLTFSAACKLARDGSGREREREAVPRFSRV